MTIDLMHPDVPHNAPECPSGENRLNDKQLNDKQLTAIEMLILGKSYSAAANELGVDRKTLFRWRQEPLFAEQLSERRRQVWAEAADRLRAMTNRSLDVMEQHLADRYDRARFRAASVILRLAQLGKAAGMGDQDCR